MTLEYTFLETHADRQKIFDSILLNKLEGFYDDLEWTLPKRISIPARFIM